MHEKYVNEMSPVTTWLLSSAAARSYPVTIPGRYGRYGYPGSYTDTDTIPNETWKFVQAKRASRQ